MGDQERVQAHLYEYALSEPNQFASHLVDILVRDAGFVGAALYLCAPSSTTLVLQAAAGLARSQSDARAHGRVVGERATTSSRVTEQPLDEQRRLVALPLTVAPSLQAPPFPSTFGAVVLVVDRERHESAPTASLSRALAATFAASVEQHAARLRVEVEAKVGYRRDVGSVAHAFLSILGETLPNERGAIWTLDPLRRVLVRRDGRGGRDSKFEISPGSPSPIMRTFASEQDLREGTSGGYIDDEGHTSASEWAAFPLRLPPGARLERYRLKAIGVLEVGDHSILEHEAPLHRALTWKDDYLFRCTSEVLSLLIYHLIRARQNEARFDRQMHGARTSLQAARSHLQALEGAGVSEHFPAHLKHFLPNALAWVQDIEAQVERDAIVNSKRLVLAPVHLYGDVLARVDRVVAQLNAIRSGSSLRITGLVQIAGTYRTIPVVLADQHAVACVLRNILDNSAKYCRPVNGEPPTVHVSLKTTDRNVKIILGDNGAPIPPDEISQIFHDGFRGERARQWRPQGLGQGLHDCRYLMAQMGGDISIDPAAPGVTFTLTFRRA
ncbi:MAG TPA: ATP-binding protein [Solirubrobacteraceae bacterium]|nr:ATP-binding protein [Solirubrobacteraceae bacterium]